MKRWHHVLVSHVTVFCFFIYSSAVPITAYADDAPPPVINLDACSSLGTPTLELTTPTFSCPSCKLYDVGPAKRYRIFDSTTNKQLDLNGTFFNADAAANLYAGLQSIEGLWQLELNRVLSYNNACWNYKLSIKDAEMVTLNTRILAIQQERDDLVEIKNGQIEFLTDQLKPAPWYKSGEFWFAIGLVSGVLVTVGAGYAIGQVNE